MSEFFKNLFAAIAFTTKVVAVVVLVIVVGSTWSYFDGPAIDQVYAWFQE